MDIKTFTRTYGLKFLLTLFIAQHILKGLVGGGGNAGWIGVPIPFLFRAIGGVNASKMQTLKAAASTPWSIKPLVGLLGDLIPICGYHKAPYIVLSTLAAGAASMVLFFLWPLSANMTTVCLFVLFLQLSVVDLMTEAKYAEKLRDAPQTATKLISFVWFGIFAMQLISTLTVGPMVEYLGPQWPYICAFAPSELILFPAICNWLGEIRTKKDDDTGIRQKVSRQPGIVALAVLLSMASLTLAGMAIAQVPEWIIFVVALGMGLLLLLSFALLSSRLIAKCVTFFFLQNVCSVSIEAASFFFFTDNALQYPEGPHFSSYFYTTAIGAVAAIFSMIGIAVYNATMKNWKYRCVLTINSLLFMLVNLLNIVVYKRWNRHMKIPDSVFVLGSDAFQQVVAMWTWIPGIVLLSQLCPKGFEASMYALLAGMNNLGTAIGSFAGAFVLQLLKVQPSGNPNESAQFDNLWMAALVAAVAPCIPLVFVHILIPNARQSDTLSVPVSPKEANNSAIVQVTDVSVI